jgi:macrolide-specific efflux system membrane fusion protein
MVAVVLVLGGCAPGGEPAAYPPPPPPPPADLDAVAVRRGDLVETATITGRLVPTQEVRLFFLEAGRLRNLNVASGDRVKTGTVLAQLEPGDLDVEVALAEVALRKADVALEEARVTGADRFTVELAVLDQAAARLRYEELRQQLAATELVAPFDGLITETTGRPGEEIAAFTPVVTLADPTELQVAAELPNENDVARLAIGQPATLVLDRRPNDPVPLEVVQLPTTATTALDGKPMPPERRRTFMLNPTDDGLAGLEPGLLGRVTLVLREKHNILLVPNAAVRAMEQRRYVLAVVNGRKREVDVEIGIVGREETEIVAGLTDGDRVLPRPGAPGNQGTPAPKPSA